MPCACIQQCATAISPTVVSLPISIFYYDSNNNGVTSYLLDRQYLSHLSSYLHTHHQQHIGACERYLSGKKINCREKMSSQCHIGLLLESIFFSIIVANRRITILLLSISRSLSLFLSFFYISRV